MPLVPSHFFNNDGGKKNPRFHLELQINLIWRVLMDNIDSQGFPLLSINHNYISNCNRDTSWARQVWNINMGSIGVCIEIRAV